MLLATFFTALPIGLYFLMGHMQEFFTRMGPISVFGQPNPISAFIESLLRHLVMFNFYGDPNMRHNYTGDPQLFLPVGILFLVGLWIILKDFFIRLKHADWENLLVPATILAWFFVMLLPGALTYEGLPHALRVIGVIPICYILAAYGGNFVYDKLKSKINPKNLAALAVLFLFVSGIYPPYRYFYQWAPSPETRNAFSGTLVSMGDYLKNAADYQKYVVIYGGDLPVQTVKLIALQNPENTNVQYIYPERIGSLELDRPSLVLFMANNQNDLDRIKAKYPKGVLSTDTESGAWVYYIDTNQ